MRTRILVTVLVVCGALTFLFWMPASTTPPLAPSVTAKEADERTPVKLVAAPMGEAERVREGVEPAESESVPTSDELERIFWDQGPSRNEDPIEEGDCVLLLKLVDRETGRAQKGLVELWRLGAPGNEHWSTGDQLQASAMVLHDGREFKDLPAGTYRAFSLGASHRTGYADAFQVGGELTEQTLLVEAPRMVETLVAIYDVSGVRLEEIEVKDAGRFHWSSKPDAPPWRVERVGAPWDGSHSTRSRSGGYGRATHKTWKLLEAEPRGFALGAFSENTRVRENQYRIALRVAGGRTVDLEINRLPEPGGHLVAVFMDEQDVLGHVLFPDGRRATEVDTTKIVYSHPVPVDELHPDSTWRDASIEVTVYRDGLSAWKRVWKPSDGPMTDRWMPADKK